MTKNLEENNTSNKLYRRIADAVADEIERGIYKVGSRLPTERELAEKFDVSRPTLREAMIALEIQGLIEAKHGMGIFVTANRRYSKSHEHDIGAFELIEARRLIEAEAAALAAINITDNEIKALDEQLVKMEDPDELKGELADMEFHKIIARATGNGAIMATIENLWAWRSFELAETIYSRARGNSLAPRIEEHRLIVDALKIRDPNAARNAMRSHLENVVNYLLEATETQEIERLKQENQNKRNRIRNA